MLKAAIVTPPSFEPVTLTEARTHLIIPSGQTDYITSLIKTSRIMVERYLNRSLMLQTWKAYADYWCKEFYLPYAPLLAVSSLKYYDQDATLQPLSSSNYFVSTVDEPGELEFVFNFTGPTLQEGRPNAIEIQFTSGYSSSLTEATQQAAVPEPIKHAMKVLMTDMHEHRGQYVIGNYSSKLPNFVIDLIHPYRLYNF
jgi:uncharacterized phiE125 gp8 family phage protein